MRRTLTKVLTEYGTIGLVVYLTIFTTVLLSAWAAINMGWQPHSVVGNVGAFTAAYLTTKVTQPLRIASTVVLTPIVAKVYQRVARRPPVG